MATRFGTEYKAPVEGFGFLRGFKDDVSMAQKSTATLTDFLVINVSFSGVPCLCALPPPGLTAALRIFRAGFNCS